MIHIKPKGRLDEVVLIKVDLTPFDKYRLFQPARRILNLSTSEFQTEFASRGSKRETKYKEGKRSTLQPKNIFQKKKKKTLQPMPPQGEPLQLE